MCTLSSINSKTPIQILDKWCLLVYMNNFHHFPYTLLNQYIRHSSCHTI